MLRKTLDLNFFMLLELTVLNDFQIVVIYLIDSLQSVLNLLVKHLLSQYIKILYS